MKSPYFDEESLCFRDAIWLLALDITSKYYSEIGLEVRYPIALKLLCRKALSLKIPYATEAVPLLTLSEGRLLRNLYRWSLTMLNSNRNWLPWMFHQQELFQLLEDLTDPTFKSCLSGLYSDFWKSLNSETSYLEARYINTISESDLEYCRLGQIEYDREQALAGITVKLSNAIFSHHFRQFFITSIAARADEMLKPLAISLGREDLP